MRSSGTILALAAFLAVRLILAHGALADLPLALTAFNPAAMHIEIENRWRNRTYELYEILEGSRSSFSPDSEIDERAMHRMEVFERILARAREKLKEEEEEIRISSVENVDISVDSVELFDQCAPKLCNAKFKTKSGVSFEMPCSTASGNIPAHPQLPLNYPGNFDLCETFKHAGAHFCKINIPFITVPVLDESTKDKFVPDVKDFVLVGNFMQGQCVPKNCHSEAIKRRFIGDMRRLAASLVFRKGHFRTDILVLESMFESTVKVSCVQESEDGQGDEFESMGTMLFFFLIGMLALMVLLATSFTAYYPHTHNKYALSFSLTQNVKTLLAPMGGEYVFLNGVRVLSMLWVIYGHTVLFSSTVGVHVPLGNPSALDAQVQSSQMAWVRGAEFAVDTFFFMSGLLAAHGIVDGMNSKRLPPLGPRSYLSLIIIRFIRLVPVYMFVMYFYIQVLPYCGAGPYWHDNVSRKSLEHSCRYWYSNLLFVNNMFTDTYILGSCMPWTWYLANDMQYFLLVPFLCALFLWQHKVVSENPSMMPMLKRFRLYGPCALLIIGQIACTLALIRQYDINSWVNSDFNRFIYTKPWCRISPYIIGCALAFYRFERKTMKATAAQHAMTSQADSLPFQKKLQENWVRTNFIGVLGLTIAVVLCTVTYDNFQCRAENKTDCHIPAAFMSYGLLVPGKWGVWALGVYVAFGYPLWGLALALMTNYAANGHGGYVTQFLSHEAFLPLARLSYTVYMVHMMCMYWFYAKSPGLLYASEARQAMDTFGFVALAYAIAVFLYLLVERPFTSVLPWLWGFEKEERRSQRTASTHLPLQRELSLVADVDSEAVIISSTVRRSSLDLQELLLPRQQSSQ